MLVNSTNKGSFKNSKINKAYEQILLDTDVNNSVKQQKNFNLSIILSNLEIVLNFAINLGRSSFR